MRQAIHAASRRLKQERRERRIAASYRAAYTATPLTADEVRVLDAAAARAGEALP
jgi:hypothetical protein